jgi:hypothetical protein
MRRILNIGLAAALVAGCASQPMAKRAETPAPAPKAGYVDVGLAAQAAAFESFTRRAAAIDPTFADPGEISQGLVTGAAYEPKQLQAGMVAYAAMAALQEPAFVQGLRSGAGRDVARQLATDPNAALSLPGGQAAAGRANAALYQRGQALASAGARVKQASYSVQKQKWSTVRISSAGALAQVKRQGQVGYQRAEGDNARVVAAVSEAGRRGGTSPIVARGVALAALTVLGQEGQARSLAAEPRSGMCLRMAKLNYHQCLASAGTHYEDIYCLGVHAMTETGQCVVDATRSSRVASR